MPIHVRGVWDLITFASNIWMVASNACILKRKLSSINLSQIFSRFESIQLQLCRIHPCTEQHLSISAFGRLRLGRLSKTTAWLLRPL